MKTLPVFQKVAVTPFYIHVHVLNIIDSSHLHYTYTNHYRKIDSCVGVRI